MCKVVTYLVNDAKIVISLSLLSYQLYCYFYIGTEFVSPFLSTSTTDLPASSLPSLSTLIVSPTPIDTSGKTNRNS